MRLVGFDPGLSGAAAFLDLTKRTLHVCALPVIRAKNGKSYLDEGVLTKIVRVHQPVVACIEDVYSSDQMGVVSAFSFGEGKGILKGILAGCDVERRYVSPAKWKADLGTSADKAHSKELARTLFPNCRKLLSSEGKCEAALICLWLALDLGHVPSNILPGNER